VGCVLCIERALKGVPLVGEESSRGERRGKRGD